MSPSASNPAASNSGPDVGQLLSESLSKASFPVPRNSAFRVYFDPLAYGRMTAHAAEDTSFEICGVLVGEWGKDADGPFVLVRNHIRCDSATKKFAEVTFTHDSWSHINQEMDTKYQDQRIVGWYHSHPNFGIFLSDRDMFIQQNFFSGPGQIALVIDPVRKIEGVFEWHDGRAIPTSHYWIGSKIALAPAGSDVTGMPEAPMGVMSAIEDPSHESAMYAPSTNRPSQSFSSPVMMLAGMGLLLIGWFLGWVRSDLERRAILEGAVAHLGIWHLLKPGFEEDLAATRGGVEAVVSQLKSLSTDHLRRLENDKEKKEGDKIAEQVQVNWKKTLELADEVRVQLRHVERLYSLNQEERNVIRDFIEQKMIELSRGRQRNERGSEPQTDSPKPPVDQPANDAKPTDQPEKSKAGAKESRKP